MKKQYQCYKIRTWKYKVDLYINGELLHSIEFWQGDNLDNYIKGIEKDGYTLGYLPDEVDDAKTIYEDMLANIIEKNDTVGTPPNYSAGEYIMNRGN